MREAVGKRRIKYHLEPTGHVSLAINHFETCRRVHPRVQGQNPKRRGSRTQGNQPSRGRVNPFTHSTSTKKHNA